MEKNDKFWSNIITILQVFAITCVFVGHCTHIYSSWGWYSHNADVIPVWNYIHHFVYSFHMPLFVFLSGYLFYKKYNSQAGIFYLIQKCAKRLMIPFVFAGALYYIPFLLVINPLNKTPYQSVMDYLSLNFNGHLWFLMTLFVITVFFVLLQKINFDKNIYVRFLLFVALIVLNLLKYKGFQWCLIQVFLLAVYFYYGKLFVEYNNQILNIKNRPILYSIITFLWLVCIVLNVTYWYNKYILLPTALVSILFFYVTTSMIVERWSQIVENRWIKYISANMMMIYIIHEPVMVTILKFLDWGNIITPYLTAPILFVSTVLVVALVLFLIKLLKSFLRFKTN